MAKMEYKSCTYNSTNKLSKLKNENTKYIFYKILVGLALVGIWQLTAMHYDKEIILPYPKNTAIAFFHCITSIEIVTNILITLGRVLKGFLWSLALGLPLGFLMGSFPLANELISWIVDSVRQVPIMAWVPLTIVWFGIGDGPTIFLIAFSGIFPIILNTIHGVKSISTDYYNAARSMGAGHLSIFKNIVIPASIPDILTGARLAISTGWMSVIWAEYIAAGAGLGFSMVEAQTRMQTDMLIALMVFAALVGFGIDRILQLLNKRLTKWRYAQ